MKKEKLNYYNRNIQVINTNNKGGITLISLVITKLVPTA